MLRFLADENFNGHVVRALKHRYPEIDVVLAQKVGLEGSSDADLLAWMAANDRLLLTHDIRTMPAYLWARVGAGLSAPAVVEVAQRAAVSTVIDDIALLGICGQADEWRNRVIFIPLR